MVATPQRAALFVTYQLSLVLGIMLMPIALVLRRAVGVVLPIHRLLRAVHAAYERNGRVN